MIVQKQGADRSHRDFRVCRHVVQSALEWLISHNLYYRNIALDRQILQDLPEDVILSELRTFTTVHNQQMILIAQQRTTQMIIYRDHLFQ